MVGCWDDVGGVWWLSMKSDGCIAAPREASLA